MSVKSLPFPALEYDVGDERCCYLPSRYRRSSCVPLWKDRMPSDAVTASIWLLANCRDRAAGQQGTPASGLPTGASTAHQRKTFWCALLYADFIRGEGPAGRGGEQVERCCRPVFVPAPTEPAPKQRGRFDIHWAAHVPDDIRELDWTATEYLAA